MTPPPDAAKTVLLALGSRFRGDDAVGPWVADRLAERGLDCRVMEGAADALTLLAAWEGARLAVVIDAAVTGAAPGSIHRVDLERTPLPKALARCTSHGLGLAEALELGRQLARLPDRLVIFAVEAKTFEPGAPLTEAVARAAGDLVQSIEAEIVAG